MRYPGHRVGRSQVELRLSPGLQARAHRLPATPALPDRAPDAAGLGVGGPSLGSVLGLHDVTRSGVCSTD